MIIIFPKCFAPVRLRVTSFGEKKNSGFDPTARVVSIKQEASPTHTPNRLRSSTLGSAPSSTHPLAPYRTARPLTVSLITTARQSSRSPTKLQARSPERCAEVAGGKSAVSGQTFVDWERRIKARQAAESALLHLPLMPFTDWEAYIRSEQGRGLFLEMPTSAEEWKRYLHAVPGATPATPKRLATLSLPIESSQGGIRNTNRGGIKKPAAEPSTLTRSRRK